MSDFSSRNGPRLVSRVLCRTAAGLGVVLLVLGMTQTRAGAAPDAGDAAIVGVEARDTQTQQVLVRFDGTDRLPTDSVRIVADGGARSAAVNSNPVAVHVALVPFDAVGADNTRTVSRATDGALSLSPLHDLTVVNGPDGLQSSVPGGLRAGLPSLSGHDATA